MKIINVIQVLMLAFHPLQTLCVGSKARTCFSLESLLLAMMFCENLRRHDCHLKYAKWAFYYSTALSNKIHRSVIMGFESWFYILIRRIKEEGRTTTKVPKKKKSLLPRQFSWVCNLFRLLDLWLFRLAKFWHTTM